MSQNNIIAFKVLFFYIPENKQTKQKVWYISAFLLFALMTCLPK